MKQNSFNSSFPSILGVHKNSHNITRLKPKIRIIHIVPPEIIKTDVENFRELVQRLTGKPAAEVKGTILEESRCNIVEAKSSHTCSCKTRKKIESAGIVKSEGEIYGENQNGFLRFLADIDDFFNNQDHIDIYGEIQLF